MSGAIKIRSLSLDTSHELRVRRTDGGYRVTCDDPVLDVLVLESGSKVLAVTSAEGTFETTVERDDDEIHVIVGQERFVFGPNEGVDADRHAARVSGGRTELKAPMPGKIARLFVAVGDSVRAGQGLLLFEAMKMQNEIRAPNDGFVVDLSVEEGQTVEAREKLMVLDRPPASQ
ncbi:MAG TPA: biotin/lipoyl-containing protein [Vicinamibacteria bacterium]|nr:biotin/lipoyl-containing protein [Vicinamibacteria bacterium]